LSTISPAANTSCMKPLDRFWRCLIVAVATCLSLTAQGKAPSQMDLLDDRRMMRVGDYLIYQVLEEREPPQVVFVNDRGRVDLPLIDEMDAAGKTPRQLAYLIKEELEQTFFHQHGQNSRGRINLVGRVARPGPVNIPADEILTVSAAITRAGSILPGADLSRVELVRDNAENAEEEERIIVDVRDVLEFGNLAADVIVRPNDIIIVPESLSAGGRFYVTGMVNREGVYSLPASICLQGRGSSRSVGSGITGFGAQTAGQCRGDPAGKGSGDGRRSAAG